MRVATRPILCSGCGTAGWEASVEAYGLRIAIRANVPQLLDQLLALLPPGCVARFPPGDRIFELAAMASDVAAADDGSTYRLFEQDALVWQTDDLDSALEAFERTVKMYVAENARERVFVHAGAVGWRGGAILVPGRSTSGKTSLVVDLVRAGATYYSDEYAVLDERGWVHPYATPLAIRSPGSLRQRKCSVEELGGTAANAPLPVRLVILSRYEPRAIWHPERLSPGEAVLGMLDNAVAARRNPDGVIGTLREVSLSAAALQGVRGESRETAELVLGSLNDDDRRR